MIIAFGCDHAGWLLRDFVMEHLATRGEHVLDFGTNSPDPVDYPDLAWKVAEAVQNQSADFGILVCGTGLGMAIAANKMNGIRAVTVSEGLSAAMARAHNDANVLTLGARILGPGLVSHIIDAFLDTSFEGGRHVRRVGKFTAIESSQHPTK